MSIPIVRYDLLVVRSKRAKRAFDVCVSSILLFVTLPITALIAMLLYLERPGPVFQRHPRIGQDDQPFALLTFRGPSIDGDPNWINEDSEQNTELGRFVHDLYLDELPQLINILKGEMSFSGPRPRNPITRVASHTARRR